MSDLDTKAGTSASLRESIAERVETLYRDVLDPVDERLLFGPRRKPGERLPMPMVLVLGNHSSGKSTFINHLLGADVQKTGLAPTDDGFTIIAPGDEEEKRDGPSLIGDPDWGFSELERFGPTLVSHVELKVRPDIPLLEQQILVDSPGMIDAASETLDRGYDFPGVVRWFAERADIILLLFDPDKPGTTGETLEILTSALADLDHKFLLVLNKVDQFRQIHDFARAYGSLCWNLSKVIPRKDLPHIYTMYVPEASEEGPGLGPEPMKDFDRIRGEVVAEVKRAPERRMDNMITRLYDTARRLRIHALVAEAARSDVFWEKWRWRGIMALVLLFTVGTTILTASLGASWTVWVPAGLIGFAIAGGTWAYGKGALKNRKERILRGLTGLFERLHVRELADSADQDILSLWTRVRPGLRTALETLDLEKLPKLRAEEQTAIEAIIQEEVPALRRKVHGDE